MNIGLRWQVRSTLLLAFLLPFSASVHGDERYSRHLHIELPTRSTVNINKTVRIIASPGTTVVYGEIVPGEPYPGYPADVGMPRLLRTSDNRCLEADSAGSTVSAGHCHGRHSQQAWLDQGRIRLAGLCLDAGYGDAGSTVSVRACRSGPEQQWLWQGAQLIHAGSGLCLDGADAANNGRLRLQDCTGSLTQRFYR